GAPGGVAGGADDRPGAGAFGGDAGCGRGGAGSSLRCDAGCRVSRLLAQRLPQLGSLSAALLSLPPARTAVAATRLAIGSFAKSATSSHSGYRNSARYRQLC